MNLQQIVRAAVPRPLITGVRLLRVFFSGHGHNRRVDGMPVSGDGTHQPWLTYPLIEYLNGMDFSSCDVFEFGAGASTLYWAARARSVTSVEQDGRWFEALRHKLPPNADVAHEPDGGRYALYPLGGRFDVVVVDGAERYRSAQTALQIVSPRGMIILDNAEWYPRTADMIEAAGFTEIRFSGFSPVNAFTSTSSVFLAPGFSLPRGAAARRPPVGGRSLPGGALDDGPQNV